MLSLQSCRRKLPGARAWKPWACRTVHGFVTERTKSIPELDLVATTYRHSVTGLEHLHIARTDSNNVFAIGFGTPPPDSSGIPHILEHTTLCGSKKYPVRDPFFKMLNRSLANYMNAFTAADHTFYPFATVNTVDYRNLRDVYLDATLAPRLLELDFCQEGWRLEHKVPDDNSSPIEFKGVVYNEMKGQMSDASYLFYILFQRELFAGTIYANDSGGDPRDMTNLSYQELISFHAKCYHPSNSKVLTYGTIPIEEQLEALNDKLSSFTTKPATKVLKGPPDLSQNRTVEVSGPMDPATPSNEQIKASISFVCNDVSDVVESFSMKILSSLLLDGHGSPFYKGLIDSHIGSDYSPNTGYDSSTKHSIFSVGVTGISENNLPQFRTVVRGILDTVVAQGFEAQKIDGLLHQAEISLKRKTANFGLNLMNSVVNGWFNGVDPISVLSWNETVEEFRHRIANGKYLESLVKKYLLPMEGTGSLEFIMRPDSEHEAKLVIDEENRLASKLRTLPASELHNIEQRGLSLAKLQNAEEDTRCLPSLQLSDIPLNGTYEQLLDNSVAGIPVKWNLEGEGLTYFRMVLPVTHVPEDLLPYFPLFADCFANLGTVDSSMDVLEDQIRLNTGGIGVSAKISTNHSDLSLYEQGFTVSGHCLDRNVSTMFTLIEQILANTNFDNDAKLRQLLKMNGNGLISSIAESGHSYARTYAARNLTPASRVTEIFSGLGQVKLSAELASKSDLSEVRTKLKQISSLVLGSRQYRCLVTTSPPLVSTVEHAMQSLFSGLSKSPVPQPCQPPQIPLPSVAAKTFVQIPSSVNFSARTFKGVPYTHKDGASLQVLSKLLSNKYLHREIREKGGAYGGGATYSATSGIFSFYSYRDPNTLRTLDTMTNAGSWAASHSWSSRDLDEAKLSVFQAVDAPVSASSRGTILLAEGISSEMRQERRERLLSTTAQDIRDVAAKYLVRAHELNTASSTILGETPTWLSTEPSWETYALGPSNLSPAQNPAVSNDAGEVRTLDTYGQTISKTLRDEHGALLSIQVTDRACTQLAKIRSQDSSFLGLRVALESGGCHGYQYVISSAEDLEEDDLVIEKNGAKVIIDKDSLELISGSKLDYTMELIGSEFKVTDNPRAVSKCGCDTSIEIVVGPKG